MARRRIPGLPYPVPAVPAGGWQATGWRLVPQRRPPVTSVRLYRPVRGVPLQPSNAQATVAGGGTSSASLVQSVTATGAASPLAVTLAATGAGNALIIAVGSVDNTTNSVVSGITLGGAGTFASAKSQNNNADSNCEIWYGQNIAGGKTAMSIAFTGGTGGGEGLTARVMEWSGLATTGMADAAGVAGASGASSGSWSSGATGTLGQAQELAVGAVSAGLVGGAATLTGPASPWTNTSQVTDGTVVALLAGYQVVSSTAAFTYAGTVSPNKFWSAAAAAFKLAVSGGAAAGTAQCQLGPAGLGNIWYPTQVTLATTTGIAKGVDSSVANLYLGPSVSPATLLGTVFGGNGVVATALPNIQPGQFLIAQWTGAVPGDTAVMNVQGTMDAIV